MKPFKSTAHSTETAIPEGTPVGELVPMPHGGAIRNGGTNKGGSGRPPSVLRERLTGSFTDRVPILEEIADGIPYQRIDVPLSTVLKHAHCPKCGDKLEKNEDLEAADIVLLTIEATASASVNDRLKSIDMMGKYGPGTVTAVNEDDIRDRLRATLEIIQARLPAELAEEVITLIEPVWR